MHLNEAVISPALEQVRDFPAWGEPGLEAGSGLLQIFSGDQHSAKGRVRKPSLPDRALLVFRYLHVPRDDHLGGQLLLAR